MVYIRPSADRRPAASGAGASGAPGRSRFSARPYAGQPQPPREYGAKVTGGAASTRLASSSVDPAAARPRGGSAEPPPQARPLVAAGAPPPPAHVSAAPPRRGAHATHSSTPAARARSRSSDRAASASGRAFKQQPLPSQQMPGTGAGEPPLQQPQQPRRAEAPAAAPPQQQQQPHPRRGASSTVTTTPAPRARSASADTHAQRARGSTPKPAAAATVPPPSAQRGAHLPRGTTHGTTPTTARRSKSGNTVIPAADAAVAVAPAASVPAGTTAAAAPTARTPSPSHPHRSAGGTARRLGTRQVRSRSADASAAAARGRSGAPLRSVSWEEPPPQPQPQPQRALPGYEAHRPTAGRPAPAAQEPPPASARSEVSAASASAAGQEEAASQYRATPRQGATAARRARSASADAVMPQQAAPAPPREPSAEATRSQPPWSPSYSEVEMMTMRTPPAGGPAASAAPLPLQPVPLPAQFTAGGAVGSSGRAPGRSPQPSATHAATSTRAAKLRAQAVKIRQERTAAARAAANEPPPLIPRRAPPPSQRSASASTGSRHASVSPNPQHAHAHAHAVAARRDDAADAAPEYAAPPPADGPRSGKAVSFAAGEAEREVGDGRALVADDCGMVMTADDIGALLESFCGEEPSTPVPLASQQQQQWRTRDRDHTSQPRSDADARSASGDGEGGCSISPPSMASSPPSEPPPRARDSQGVFYTSVDELATAGPGAREAGSTPLPRPAVATQAVSVASVDEGPAVAAATAATAATPPHDPPTPAVASPVEDTAAPPPPPPRGVSARAWSVILQSRKRATAGRGGSAAPTATATAAAAPSLPSAVGDDAREARVSTSPDTQVAQTASGTPPHVKGLVSAMLARGHDPSFTSDDDGLEVSHDKHSHGGGGSTEAPSRAPYPYLAEMMRNSKRDGGGDGDDVFPARNQGGAAVPAIVAAAAVETPAAACPGLIRAALADERTGCAVDTYPMLASAVERTSLSPRRRRGGGGGVGDGGDDDRNHQHHEHPALVAANSMAADCEGGPHPQQPATAWEAGAPVTPAFPLVTDMLQRDGAEEESAPAAAKAKEAAGKKWLDKLAAMKEKQAALRRRMHADTTVERVDGGNTQSATDAAPPAPTGAAASDGVSTAADDTATGVSALELLALPSPQQVRGRVREGEKLRATPVRVRPPALQEDRGDDDEVMPDTAAVAEPAAARTPPHGDAVEVNHAPAAVADAGGAEVDADGGSPSTAPVPDDDDAAHTVAAGTPATPLADGGCFVADARGGGCEGAPQKEPVVAGNNDDNDNGNGNDDGDAAVPEEAPEMPVDAGEKTVSAAAASSASAVAAAAAAGTDARASRMKLRPWQDPPPPKPRTVIDYSVPTFHERAPGKLAAAAHRRMAEGPTDPTRPLPAHKDPRPWRRSPRTSPSRASSDAMSSASMSTAGGSRREGPVRTRSPMGVETGRRTFKVDGPAGGGGGATRTAAAKLASAAKQRGGVSTATATASAPPDDACTTGSLDAMSDAAHSCSDLLVSERSSRSPSLAPADDTRPPPPQPRRVVSVTAAAATRIQALVRGGLLRMQLRRLHAAVDGLTTQLLDSGAGLTPVDRTCVVDFIEATPLLQTAGGRRRFARLFSALADPAYRCGLGALDAYVARERAAEEVMKQQQRPSAASAPRPDNEGTASAPAASPSSRLQSISAVSDSIPLWGPRADDAPKAPVTPAMAGGADQSSDDADVAEANQTVPCLNVVESKLTSEGAAGGGDDHDEVGGEDGGGTADADVAGIAEIVDALTAAVVDMRAGSPDGALAAEDVAELADYYTTTPYLHTPAGISRFADFLTLLRDVGVENVVCTAPGDATAASGGTRADVEAVVANNTGIPTAAGPEPTASPAATRATPAAVDAPAAAEPQPAEVGVAPTETTARSQLSSFARGGIDHSAYDVDEAMYAEFVAAVKPAGAGEAPAGEGGSRALHTLVHDGSRGVADGVDVETALVPARVMQEDRGDDDDGDGDGDGGVVAAAAADEGIKQGEEGDHSAHPLLGDGDGVGVDADGDDDDPDAAAAAALDGVAVDLLAAIAVLRTQHTEGLPADDLDGLNTFVASTPALHTRAGQQRHRELLQLLAEVGVDTPESLAATPARALAPTPPHDDPPPHAHAEPVGTAVAASGSDGSSNSSSRRADVQGTVKEEEEEGVASTGVAPSRAAISPSNFLTARGASADDLIPLKFVKSDILLSFNTPDVDVDAAHAWRPRVPTPVDHAARAAAAARAESEVPAIEEDGTVAAPAGDDSTPSSAAPPAGVLEVIEEITCVLHEAARGGGCNGGVSANDISDIMSFYDQTPYLRTPAARRAHPAFFDELARVGVVDPATGLVRADAAAAAPEGAPQGRGGGCRAAPPALEIQATMSVGSSGDNTPVVTPRGAARGGGRSRSGAASPSSAGGGSATPRAAPAIDAELHATLEGIQEACAAARGSLPEEDVAAVVTFLKDTPALRAVDERARYPALFAELANCGWPASRIYPQRASSARGGAAGVRASLSPSNDVYIAKPRLHDVNLVTKPPPPRNARKTRPVWLPGTKQQRALEKKQTEADAQQRPHWSAQYQARKAITETALHYGAVTTRACGFGIPGHGEEDPDAQWDDAVSALESEAVRAVSEVASLTEGWTEGQAHSQSQSQSQSQPPPPFHQRKPSATPTPAPASVAGTPMPLGAPRTPQTRDQATPEARIHVGPDVDAGEDTANPADLPPMYRSAGSSAFDQSFSEIIAKTPVAGDGVPPSVSASPSQAGGSPRYTSDRRGITLEKILDGDDVFGMAAELTPAERAALRDPDPGNSVAQKIDDLARTLAGPEGLGSLKAPGPRLAAPPHTMPLDMPTALQLPHKTIPGAATAATMLAAALLVHATRAWPADPDAFLHPAEISEAFCPSMEQILANSNVDDVPQEAAALRERSQQP